MRLRAPAILILLFSLPLAAADAILWRAPADIARRDLIYGQGGKVGRPAGSYRFIKEDKGGTSPKFIVQDARGMRWKVKLGPEAQSETAATRLLWAAGYFTDEDYYLPTMKVAGLPELERGEKYVSDGTVHGARLERMHKDREVGTWSWFDNPFIGTKQFDGLRVLVVMMNGWDLKESNNRVEKLGQQHRYVVADLGATFGKSGSNWSRSKSDLEDYLESKFIDDIEGSNVDLKLKTRPPAPYVFSFPYYAERTKMAKIAQDIPRAHARWIGSWLARLSDRQIADAFRAAGYETAIAEAYMRKVRSRIVVLTKL